MKRKFILVFTLLLISLLMVNAVPPQLHKRVTTFEPCSKAPLDVTKIIPDPLVSGKMGEFYVSGTLAKTIPNDYILAALYFDVSKNVPKLINLNWATVCKPDGALECPYSANNTFSVKLSVSVPALPPSYGIVVAIGMQNLKMY